MTKLQISLEALPPPETKRTERYMVSFSPAEAAMIEAAARGRGEQPAVFLRTIILTAFQNSAIQALTDEPDLLRMSPLEQQRALLSAFSIEEPAPALPPASRALRPGAPARSRGRPRSR